MMMSHQKVLDVARAAQAYIDSDFITGPWYRALVDAVETWQGNYEQEARRAMLNVMISTKVITWLCNELGCKAVWAEEFAQSFISFLQASGSISIEQRKETSEKEMLQFEHIKNWASQNHDGLSARQVADAVVRMCNDALAEAEAAEQVAQSAATGGGYQPTHGDLDPSNPPRGGSGVPSGIPAAAPQKPDWWPKNPYPIDIFPMARERYPEIVPDPQLRTALSGMLGREFWDIAVETIWEAMLEAVEDGYLTIITDKITDGCCTGTEYFI